MNKQRFEMHRRLSSLKHLSQLLLFRSPSLRTMSTTTSVDPFSNSCSQLDKLIKKLESDLGVQEPFDVKKAMSAQAVPAAAAPAAQPKAAAAGASGAAAAASGGAAAQDAAVKPKKEKVDKPAAPPKAPPVRKCALSLYLGLISRRPLPSPTSKRSTCAWASLYRPVRPSLRPQFMSCSHASLSEKHPDADSLYASVAPCALCLTFCAAVILKKLMLARLSRARYASAGPSRHHACPLCNR